MVEGEARRPGLVTEGRPKAKDVVVATIAVFTQSKHGEQTKKEERRRSVRAHRC